MSTVIAKGKINCGKLDWYRRGRKINSVEIEWHLDEGEFGPTFAASGGVWNGSKTDYICCGQMIDEIAERVKESRRVQRIAEIWRAYHLNDTNAGTSAQEQAAAEYREGKSYPDNQYGPVVEHLKSIGLYEVPAEGLQALGGLPEEVTSGKRGYRYGERWLYRPIPREIVDEITSWSTQA